MGFQMTGAAVLLLFYGCYMLKILAQRNKGVRADQMGRGKTGFVKRIELTLRAAAYGTVFAETVSIVLGTTCFLQPVGVCKVITNCIEMAVFVLSVLTLRDSWRVGVPRGCLQTPETPC